MFLFAHEPNIGAAIRSVQSVLRLDHGLGGFQLCEGPDIRPAAHIAEVQAVVRKRARGINGDAVGAEVADVDSQRCADAV